MPVESTTVTVFGGGDMTEVSSAIQALNSSTDLLDEREVIEAAKNGWRQLDVLWQQTPIECAVRTDLCE